MMQHQRERRELVLQCANWRGSSMPTRQGRVVEILAFLCRREKVEGRDGLASGHQQPAEVQCQHLGSGSSLTSYTQAPML